MSMSINCFRHRHSPPSTRGSVLILSIALIMIATILVMSYIRTMSRYHSAAISDIFNTYSELAMNSGKIHAIQVLQNAALSDDPNDPDFYSTFQSSWRTSFRRDKTLEPGGQWPDATIEKGGDASWELPQHSVASRSDSFRTYGPGASTYNSDRMSDGMLQLLAWKKDGESSVDNEKQFTIGASAGARWHETTFLDNEGQPVAPADKDSARYTVRYAVEMIDLSGFMGFNFYPEDNTDWSSLGPIEALEKRKYYRALRERYGTIHMAHSAMESNYSRYDGRSTYSYNVLPKSMGTDNAHSVEPLLLAYRHHLEPYRLEDSPFKTEKPVNSGSGFENFKPNVNNKSQFWSFYNSKHLQIYDLFQGHGQIWAGSYTSEVYKTQVPPGPYYSYQSLASSTTIHWDDRREDSSFIRPHTYNLFDSGLSVDKGDDCDTPFRVNILTATPLSLENMFKRHLGKTAYVNHVSIGKSFDGPGILAFPYALGDPLMPFSNDPASANMHDDNLTMGQPYTYSNTADAPIDSTLDTWFERTGSMYQWFYALGYNEGRQIGPRHDIWRSFLREMIRGETYGGFNGKTPLGKQTAQWFARRHKFELNTVNTYEHDVLDALVGAVVVAQRVWTGQSQIHKTLTSTNSSNNNTKDFSLEALQEEWEDFAWARMGSTTSTLADITDDSNNALSTIHDVERLFLRILGEKIDTNRGNARGLGTPYTRQDPKTWRALPRGLAGHTLDYNNNEELWRGKYESFKTEHTLPVINYEYIRHRGRMSLYGNTPDPRSWANRKNARGTLSPTRLRDHQNTAGMERLVNDIRMSYFGSPAIDFNFDGFAESSVNGWNDGGDNLQTWMDSTSRRGGQKDPNFDSYGPGSRDASGLKQALPSANPIQQTLREQHVNWMELDEGADTSRAYGFSSAGRLYMGKSKAYRIFIRGQVWDTVRNKKTSEISLDMVYCPNPSDDPTTYIIEDSDLSDSHIIMQRPIRNFNLVNTEGYKTE